MFRTTTLKISLFSAFATLFLLIAMLASSGTASAHTANRHVAAITPQLAIYDIETISPDCKEMFVLGSGFTPGPIHLETFGYPFPLTLTPNDVPAFSNGNFSQDLIICGNGFGSPSASAIVIAIDTHLHKSNAVTV
jgi:hypothetical protein